MFHRVECVSDSVSINISLMCASWADIVLDTLRTALIADDSFRRIATFDSHAEAVTQLQSKLSALQNVIGGLISSNAAERIIPKGRMLPAVADIDVRRSRLQNKDMSFEPVEQWEFRRNRFATLVRSVAVGVRNQLRDDDDDGGSDLDVDSDADDDASLSDDGDAEKVEPDNTDEEHGGTLFLLNVGCSGDDFTSVVRVKLLVPDEITVVADHLASHQHEESISMAHLFGMVPKDHHGLVTTLLRVLTFNGYGAATKRT